MIQDFEIVAQIEPPEEYEHRQAAE